MCRVSIIVLINGALPVVKEQEAESQDQKLSWPIDPQASPLALCLGSTASSNPSTHRDQLFNHMILGRTVHIQTIAAGFKRPLPTHCPSPSSKSVCPVFSHKSLEAQVSCALQAFAHAPTLSVCSPSVEGDSDRASDDG